MTLTLRDLVCIDGDEICKDIEGRTHEDDRLAREMVTHIRGASNEIIGRIVRRIGFDPDKQITTTTTVNLGTILGEW